MFTADLICHGVPSPGLFKKYVEQCVCNSGKDVQIKRYRFRIKTKYEKTGYYTVIDYTDGRYKIIQSGQDLYYNLFLNGITFRESCYYCLYASLHRTGDITIGDCARAKSYEYICPDVALSTVLLNTQHGIDLWEQIRDKFHWTLADLNAEAALNRPLYKPFPRPKMRDTVYCDLMSQPLMPIGKSYMKREPVKIRIKKFIMRRIPIKTRRKIKSIIKGLILVNTE